MSVTIKMGKGELSPKELLEKISAEFFQTALKNKDKIAGAFLNYFDDEKDAAECYYYYYKMSDIEKEFSCQIAAEIVPVCLNHLGFVYKSDGIYSRPDSPKSEVEIRDAILKIYSRSILEKEQIAISSIKMSNYNDEHIERLCRYYNSASENTKNFIDLLAVIFSSEFLMLIQREAELNSGEKNDK